MARLGLFALAVAVLALASSVASQAPGPAPSADCASALAYVQQGSTQGKPDRECCAGVKAALKSPATVACLCAAVAQNYGMPVNLTRGAGLPAACGEDHAALSKCNSQYSAALVFALHCFFFSVNASCSFLSCGDL
jgi:hypothetical protein